MNPDFFLGTESQPDVAKLGIENAFKPALYGRFRCEGLCGVSDFLGRFFKRRAEFGRSQGGLENVLS